MGKNIVILMLVLITSSLWAKCPFSDINSIEKVIELSNNTDLLIEGKVTSIETIYQHRKEKYLMNENEITYENAGKMLVMTKFSFEIIEKYSNSINEESKIVEVWIPGGFFWVDGKRYYQNRSESSYANLEIGDILILGLTKNNNENSSVFNTGYRLYENSDQLQIPSSDKMIEEVEEGELDKAKRRVYKKKLKSLEEPNSNEFPSYEELDNNLLEASIKKNEKIDSKKKFIKNLKNSLRREYE